MFNYFYSFNIFNFMRMSFLVLRTIEELIQLTFKFFRAKILDYLVFDVTNSL